MAWLRHGGIAALTLVSLAAQGCDAEIGSHAGSSSGVGGGSTGGAAGSGPVAPGASRFLQDATTRPMPLRRLTRVEYGNVVQQLLGVTAAPALLPDDSLSSGFTSTAGQLMTIASASRYLDAARDLAMRVEPTLGALMPCPALGNVDAEATCVESFLSATGSRLFRRPVTEREKARYVAAFKAARAMDTYEHSASLVVEALLVAPEFLFVEEPSGGAAGTRHALDSWQVASRLSLLLWDSVPDDALLGLAQTGTLTQADVVAPQVERMLADDKARQPIRSFFDDWLELAKIENVTRDAVAYPSVTQPVLANLAEESRLFVAHVFWEENDFRKLFVSGARYRNQTLSGFYGDALGQSAALQRYDAEISEHSFGLLSQAGVLMTLAQSQKTAAIHRGVFLRRKLLCEALPPPPPGLATPLPEITAGVSSRQRITEHTSSPVCASCHVRINPLGFTLDHFDIAGHWREQDEGLPIDTKANAIDAGFTGEIDGARALSEQLAKSPNAAACVAQQLFTFALGRRPAQTDAALFDASFTKFEASGFSLKTLVTALVTSDDFRARVEPPEVLP